MTNTDWVHKKFLEKYSFSRLINNIQTRLHFLLVVNNHFTIIPFSYDDFNVYLLTFTLKNIFLSLTLCFTHVLRIIFRLLTNCEPLFYLFALVPWITILQLTNCPYSIHSLFTTQLL